MSQMINIGPMISKVITDMVAEQDNILDVDSVYTALMQAYGGEIFRSERMLAEVAVRQKIKAHLRSAHSINGNDEDAQLSLIGKDKPSTIAVKRQDGGYAYVPLRMASVADLDAATRAKRENIRNVQAALKRWEEVIEPIRAIMESEGVSYGDAARRVAERAEAKAISRKETGS